MIFFVVSDKSLKATGTEIRIFLTVLSDPFTHMHTMGINTFFDSISAHPEVLHNEMQYVDQLWYSVPLLHNDLTSPVGQHLVAVLHPSRHSWGQYSHGLSHNGPGLHSVSLQQAVENLGK